MLDVNTENKKSKKEIGVDKSANAKYTEVEVT